eukprot:Nk52_evm15s2325 gene=Nk52_evmTU15s2325
MLPTVVETDGGLPETTKTSTAFPASKNRLSSYSSSGNGFGKYGGAEGGGKLIANQQSSFFLNFNPYNLYQKQQSRWRSIIPSYRQQRFLILNTSRLLVRLFPTVLFNLYFGFIFWTLFTILPTVIWFFAMNAMALTGYEVWLVMYFTPLLLCVGFIRRRLRKNQSIAMLHLCSLVFGVCGIYILSKIEPAKSGEEGGSVDDAAVLRMTFVCVGTGFSCLALYASLMSNDGRKTEALNGTLYGFLLLVTIRLYCISYNPIWSSDLFVNVGCLVLGLFACAHVWKTPEDLSPCTGERLSGHGVGNYKVSPNTSAPGSPQPSYRGGANETDGGSCGGSNFNHSGHYEHLCANPDDVNIVVGGSSVVEGRGAVTGRVGGDVERNVLLGGDSRGNGTDCGEGIRRSFTHTSGEDVYASRPSSAEPIHYYYINDTCEYSEEQDCGTTGASLPFVNREESPVLSAGQGRKSSSISFSAMPIVGRQSVLSAMGLGSAFFLLHWLFSEASVIPRILGTNVKDPVVNDYGENVFTTPSSPLDSYQESYLHEISSRQPFSPFQDSACCILALFIGLKLSHYRHIVEHPAYALMGLICATLFWLVSPVQSQFVCMYLGGFGLAIYTMSVFPGLLCNFIDHSSRWCFVSILLISCTHVSLILSTVWVVAYKFVPGGEIFRERTYAVLVVSVLLLVAGHRSAVKETTRAQRGKNRMYTGTRKSAAAMSEAEIPSAGTSTLSFKKDGGNFAVEYETLLRMRNRSSHSAVSPSGDNGMWGFFRKVYSLMFGGGRRKSFAAPGDGDRQSKSSLLGNLLHRWSKTPGGPLLFIFNITFALFFIVAFVRRQHNIVTNIEHRQVSKNHDGYFSGMIWTIHFGLDNYGWPNADEILHSLQDVNPDVVGLLETDTVRAFMGNMDLVQYLSEELGYYSDYGPPTKEHTWGCALMSRYPIVNSTHHLLPSPEGELACAIDAYVLMPGDEYVRVVVAHMGNSEDALDRALQTRRIGQMMRSPTLGNSGNGEPFVQMHKPREVDTTTSTIFLGYVVTKPHGTNYLDFTMKGKAKDIDPDEEDRWCEYIFYKGTNLRRRGFGRIHHSNITDTEIQLGLWEHLPASKPPLADGTIRVKLIKKEMPIGMTEARDGEGGGGAEIDIPVDFSEEEGVGDGAGSMEETEEDVIVPKINEEYIRDVLFPHKFRDSGQRYTHGGPKVFYPDNEPEIAEDIRLS